MRGDLLVRKAGVGMDRWPKARAVVLDSGALLVTSTAKQEEDGPFTRVTPAKALHLYSAGAWLQVSHERPAERPVEPPAVGYTTDELLPT